MHILCIGNLSVSLVLENFYISAGQVGVYWGPIVMIINEAEHLSVSLLFFGYPLLNTSSPLLLIFLLSFFFMNYRNSLYIRNTTLYQLHILQIFSPTLCSPFHCLDGVFGEQILFLYTVKFISFCLCGSCFCALF